MTQEHQDTENTAIELFSYDPVVVVWDVVKRWYLVLAAALLLGMAAFVGAKLTYQPNYTTTTTFVVSSQESAATVYQNLTAANGLAAVFSEVLNSSILRETVLEDLDIPAFTGTITAEAVEETNLLTVKVTDHDPRTAFLVTRSIIEHHPVVTRQVVGNTVLEVLQQPVVPAAPDNPLAAGHSMKKAALLGAAGMCALLAVLSILRDTVRSRSEAEEKLDERVLGELRHEQKYKRSDVQRLLKTRQKTSILVTNPTTSFSYVEGLRKLRRQVEQHMPEGGKILLVTSALENEGKSTVAVNLALALAQKQKRVLLVDCDLRKPACYKILEQTWQGAGVADVLAGTAVPEDVILPCARMHHLDLLLETGEHMDSNDLLSGPAMGQLLEALGRKYDCIILDTPPMAAAPDAECLAQLADASLLVVRQNMAGTKLLTGMLDVLRGEHARLLGCVLNDVYAPVLSEFGNSTGYGYGYGYGYGHYGKYGKYGHYGKYGAYGRGTGKSGKVGNAQ